MCSCSCLASYSLCLASHSRMAAAAPLLSAIISWLFSNNISNNKKIQKSHKRIIFTTIFSLPLAVVWFFVIQADIGDGMLSEIGRMQIWGCHLQNSIMAGNNKIAYGFGYNWKEIQEICCHWSSHSAYVQLLGMHGLLGVAALIIILSYAFKGVIKNLHIKNILSSPLEKSWVQISLGLFIYILLTAVSNTSHYGCFLNPLAIGLLLSATQLKLVSAP